MALLACANSARELSDGASTDHRVLDGLAATRFLHQVKRWLESVDDNLPLY